MVAENIDVIGSDKKILPHFDEIVSAGGNTKLTNKSYM